MDGLVIRIVIAERGHPFNNHDKDSIYTMSIRGTPNRRPLLHLITSRPTSTIPINSFRMDYIRMAKPIMVLSIIEGLETVYIGARDD